MLINDVNGDIVASAGTVLSAWTLNGELLAWQVTGKSLLQHSITSLACAKLTDWQPHTACTVISGHRDGKIRFWSLYIPNGMQEIKGTMNTELRDSATIKKRQEMQKKRIGIDSNSADPGTATTVYDFIPEMPTFQQRRYDNDNDNDNDEKNENSASDGGDIIVTQNNNDNNNNNNTQNNKEIGKEKEEEKIETGNENENENEKGEETINNKNDSNNTANSTSLHQMKNDTSLRFRLMFQRQKHVAPVTQIHTSLHTQQYLWTACSDGVVLQWTLHRSEDHWLDDSQIFACQKCKINFKVFERRHHCRFFVIFFILFFFSIF